MPPAAPSDPPPAFLCDEMLRGLARWLRAAGYDTGTAVPGGDDGSLLARAMAERRLLLTRDRKILERRHATRHVLLLGGQSLDAWAGEMRRQLRLSWWHAPFSRCLLCNTPLEPAPAGFPAPAVTWCPACRKGYWPGGHTRRMADWLGRWRERHPMADG